MDYNELKNLIEELLQKLTVQIDNVELIEDDIHPVFLIKTNDSGVLIGNNGENLRALNYLIRRIVGKKARLGETTSERAGSEQAGDTKPEQFLIDVNGYYRRRIQELKNQAAILAGRAKMFKSNVEMNPMNAYERMIIHSIFTDDVEIKTESEGEGKFRRVVLKYVAHELRPTIDSELKV